MNQFLIRSVNFDFLTVIFRKLFTLLEPNNFAVLSKIEHDYLEMEKQEEYEAGIVDDCSKSHIQGHE